MPRIYADEMSRIQRTVLEERALHAGDIADGKCKTFDAYQLEIGYVRGLDFALNTILRITGSTGED